ncbi:MAG: hypothetical protein M1497_14040 [Nitrospirae bacterium]|nr:hypothetical protein [Nitrospirota bacterium]
MLLPSQRATLCLGPFKDQEDRLRKIREDREKEAKPKADLGGLVRKSRELEYWINKTLFESKAGAKKRNEGESDE